MRDFLLGTALAAVTASGAMADDAALLLGNDSYERLGRVTRGSNVLEASDGLEALGFDVITLRNGRADTTRDALTSFADLADGADRIVVALSGRFAHDGDRNWFLTSESAEPRLFTLGAQAVSVDSLLNVLAEAPGRALLLIGDESEGSQFGKWLASGTIEGSIPQGVTIATGRPRDVAAFANDVLSQPQENIAPYFEDYSLTVTGYAPDTMVFMPQRPSTVPEPPQPTNRDNGAEQALWEGSRALDTAEAYRNYIRRFPNGEHAEEAERLIAEILAEPNRDARMAEEDLNLSRDARREIQRDLSLLDYNTRGIDGIFGNGTRQAITNWQQQNGYSQTSYLTEEQIARLDAQASRRAAELEAEAERRRQEAERLDRAFWEETGSKGDEPGLRAYLERYPDGNFAEVATERLAAIEEDKRAAAAAEDRNAWDKARDADNMAAYQDYLSAYPEGDFVGEAQARIQEITDEREQQSSNEAARAEEEALGLNGLTRRLVETRLAQMELNPGPVDGNFNGQTRRAIRRYQDQNGLPVTGFLNEATIVRLLADAVNSLNR
ncbi:peptidoglycan-binding protein [Marivivens aquimaris]|uniref:peptidoglycan-binding protein n=1 Tax=Marivivens aquimaris TaxID=2774876 RepID=UPI001880DC92|nr:peptidoglycan-binding protein [Marivivens aquimaris]